MSAGSGRQRFGLGLMAMLPVALALLQAGHSLLDHGPILANPCWVMGNGWVVRPPGDAGCPLQTLDRVRVVESTTGVRTAVNGPLELNRALLAAGPGARIEAKRNNRTMFVPYPVRLLSSEAAFARWYAAGIVALLLMMIPLSVLWRSKSAAAVPLILIEASIAVVAISMIAGRSSAIASILSAVAFSLVPAGLAHLGLCFPVRRRVLEDVPIVAAIPYCLAGFVGLVGVAGLTVSPLLFTTYFWLVIASALGSWLVLMLACLFSVRESESSVERGRARLVAYGALSLPLLPAAWMLHENSTVPEIASTYLWSCFLVLSLPIGLAISRYNLFDLGWDARKWIGRVIYLGSGGLVVSVAVFAWLAQSAPEHPLGELGILFAISITGLAAVETIRSPLLGFLESVLTPQLEELGRARDRFAREIVQLRDEDAVAERLGRVLARALSPRRGTVFLWDETGWHVAHVFGDEPAPPLSLVPRIEAALGGAGSGHLALAADAGNAAALDLDAAGFEIAASLDNAGVRYGLVLLGRPRRAAPYNGVELDFAAAVSQRAGAALHNSRLARQLIVAERHAATSRVAVSLIHDVGKDLGWIRQLVRRIQRHRGLASESLEDLAEVGELSESVTRRMREFMLEASRSCETPPGVSSLEEVLEASLSSVAQRHGADRVRRNIEPALRRLRCHENVGRSLSHLVENGLQASAPDRLVRIAARELEQGWVELVVTDEGPGIPRDLVDAAFEPGFTTRRNEGGTGVGLSVAREMVEALGGRIELVGSPTGGTRATLRMPPMGSTSLRDEETA